MSGTRTTSEQQRSRPAPESGVKPPVLKVTPYDKVSSWLIAAVIALSLVCVCLTVVWVTNLAPEAKGSVPLELIDLAGGAEDGTIDETLQLESPDPESSDPSLADVAAEETEIQEVLENVVELADAATNQASRQFETDTQNAGKPGSASGSGRRALGMGPGQAGLPREQRWFVSFAGGHLLEEYARQLDFFGIELGALLPGGKIVYLSKLSAPAPMQRTSASGKGEDRLYMVWQGGERRGADLQLFRKAGVPVQSDTVTFHFYPPQTEALLAKLERERANRPPDQIRRTFFSVQREGNGYRFVVTQQSYF